MPGAAKFKLDKSWKRLEKKLSSTTFSPVLRRHMRLATRLIGKQAEAAIRQEMKSGSFEPNAPLTIALKGGKNEPLIGGRTGSPLFKSVTSKVVDDLTVFVGVLQTEGVYNIAVSIHEGRVIGVTAAMRGLFFILFKKEMDPATPLTGRAQELWDQMPGGWRPLKDSTKAIVIPGRPFIKQAWNKGDIQKMARKLWQQAEKAALKELSQ